MSPTGSVSILFTRPISGTILILSIVILLLPLALKRLRRAFSVGFQGVEKL